VLCHRHFQASLNTAFQSSDRPLQILSARPVLRMSPRSASHYGRCSQSADEGQLRDSWANLNPVNDRADDLALRAPVRLIQPCPGDKLPVPLGGSLPSGRASGVPHHPLVKRSSIVAVLGAGDCVRRGRAGLLARFGFRAAAIEQPCLLRKTS
jgi:hypothetical protein